MKNEKEVIPSETINAEVEQILNRDWSKEEINESAKKDLYAAISLLGVIAENPVVLDLVVDLIHAELQNRKK